MAAIESQAVSLPSRFYRAGCGVVILTCTLRKQQVDSLSGTKDLCWDQCVKGVAHEHQDILTSMLLPLRLHCSLVLSDLWWCSCIAKGPLCVWCKESKDDCRPAKAWTPQ